MKIGRAVWLLAGLVAALFLVKEAGITGLSAHDMGEWSMELLSRENESPAAEDNRSMVLCPVEITETARSVPAYSLKTIADIRVQCLPAVPCPADDTLTDHVLNRLASAEAPLPDAVAAFLTAQGEFADYAPPENVSYQLSDLPFSYSAPVEGFTSSGFGYRMHPVYGQVRFHYGTDIAAYTGESILAFAGGEVLTAGYSDSYGNYIILAHDEHWQSLYAHCHTLLVSAGDRVEAGQTIALVGATGVVTGPHLHFELTCDGIYQNPEYYVNYI